MKSQNLQGPNQIQKEVNALSDSLKVEKKQENSHLLQQKVPHQNISHTNPKMMEQSFPQFVKIQPHNNLIELKPQISVQSKQAQVLTPAQQTLKSELEAMQFEQKLIMSVIRSAANLDQAIEMIITLMENQEKKEGSSNEVKVYFIVRMDLKMGTGKIAAQVGHAALRAYQYMRHSSSINDNHASLLIEWMENGQKNKILQAQTQNDLENLLEKASQRFINNCYIRDAGRTQIAAGSMTVAAIGPVRQCDVDFLKGLQEL